ncbi:DUF1178 family protein [Pelagibacterales bacterium SAG-MED13]|nr:DUF1178 family protein [Pelagibacterales bacterium SAG-MED13]
MIKYRLNCKGCNINFDSWFASSKEYEKLKKKKLLSCHNCGSLRVEKSIMAPKLISKTNNQGVDQDFKKIKFIKNTIKEYQKFIKSNFRYVGENFAYEARSIHYDKKKKGKGIYGTASKKDILELKQEGINTQIVPWIDKKDN